MLNTVLWHIKCSEIMSTCLQLDSDGFVRLLWLEERHFYVASCFPFLISGTEQRIQSHGWLLWRWAFGQSQCTSIQCWVFVLTPFVPDFYGPSAPRYISILSSFYYYWDLAEKRGTRTVNARQVCIGRRRAGTRWRKRRASSMLWQDVMMWNVERANCFLTMSEARQHLKTTLL